MKSSKLWKLVTIIVSLTWSVTASGKIIYVDAHAHGSNNGTSWENAYFFLQDALTDAKSSPKPVEIRVAQGTHTPDRSSAAPLGTGNKQAVFGLINGVHLIGGYAGYGKADPNERDVKAYKSVLSGDLSGNDGPGWDWDHCYDNSYKIVDGSGTDASAILDGFTITRVMSGDAGLYNSNGSPTVINCTFIWNWVNGEGGGISNWNSSAPRVTNCTFIYNVAEDRGGGVLNTPSCDSIITNCIFRENSFGVWNGEWWSYSGYPVMTNCTFLGNLYAGIKNYASFFVVTNCILWEEEPVDEDPYHPCVPPTITYSDVKDSWIGRGNINADPCFVDAVGGDFHLRRESLCIDAGSNSGAEQDLDDMDGDGITKEVIPVDMDGNGRFADDPNTPDTGSSVFSGYPVIDIGAYEYPGKEPIAGDVNGDGYVDWEDFAIMASHWLEGTKPKSD